MILQDKMLSAIRSVLVIHPSQRNNTDNKAGEACAKIASQHAIAFLEWEKTQTRFKCLSDNKTWAITLPASAESDMVITLNAEELYEYWMDYVLNKERKGKP